MGVLQRKACWLAFAIAVLLAGCTEGEDQLIEPVERVLVLVAVEDIPRRMPILEAIDSGLIEEQQQEKPFAAKALRPDLTNLSGLASIAPIAKDTRLDVDMFALPDEFGNVRAESEGIRYISLEDLTTGNVIQGDWESGGCGGILDGAQRFNLDRLISTKDSNRAFVASDFAADLDVFVMNDEANDGPAYALLNIAMQQIDNDTIEMHNIETGELIANFVRDTSDPAEWEC